MKQELFLELMLDSWLGLTAAVLQQFDKQPKNNKVIFRYII